VARRGGASGPQRGGVREAVGLMCGV